MAKTTKRYLIGVDETFEAQKYSFVYDTKYKRFVDIQRLETVRPKVTFSKVELAPPNFYVYFPGFATELTESDTLP